jgi:hypothetical protein
MMITIKKNEFSLLKISFQFLFLQFEELQEQEF